MNLVQKGTITIEEVEASKPAEVVPVPEKEKSGSLTPEQKKENRFYLPVININKETEWPSLPLSERRHFTDKVAYEVCLGSCCGVEGLKAGCCFIDLDDPEHVLGPLVTKDGKEDPWIMDTVRKLSRNGQNITRADIVIDYEEGKIIGEKFFNGHPVFASKTSYPMMRFQVIGPRFACKFLNPVTKKCTIYTIRPDMCRNYLCNYVKSSFLVRTKSHPNTYTKVR